MRHRSLTLVRSILRKHPGCQGMNLKDALYHLYVVEKMSIQQITDLLYPVVSWSTVRKLLVKSGVPLRRRGGKVTQGQSS